ncbi:lysogenization regulator [Actinobacillus equuli]|nr:lysogenization regulator [Actinobacillus equuli]
MSTNYHDITLAFAGVCQAVSLVQQFAHRGSADRDVFSHSIKSLLATQPESTLAVFGDQLSHLKTGLETVQAQMGSPNGKLDTEIGRYWINVLALSQKLNKILKPKPNWRSVYSKLNVNYRSMKMILWRIK